MAQSGAAKQGTDSEVARLRKRVEQLEEQLVDIQVVLGTLESLARTGAGKAGAAGGVQSGGAMRSQDAGRLSALETQVRALTAQLQQQGGSTGVAQAPLPSNGAASVRGWNATGGSARGGPQVAAPSFGSTTVQPRREPAPSRIARRDESAAASWAQPSRPAGGAQKDYEAAYGLLLQQDYGAAREAFSRFLSVHSKHTLAGNAQYWLGETFYVQGQYKSAAGAFLTGYRNYQSGSKAPDSLLKLAMSLDRLGQRSSACSSLSELRAKFPQAPQHVSQRAGQERRRLQC